MKSATASPLPLSSEKTASQKPLGDKQPDTRPRRSFEQWQADTMANLNKMSSDPAYRKEVARRQS